MGTVELISERAKALPDSLQAEVLHYVDYLLTHKHAQAESADWARFSTEQLASQYAPGDAVYDTD